MALDASSSLGAAIGLAGTPTDKADKFYEMGIKADTVKAKAEASKAAKEEKEVERLARMFKVDLGAYLPKTARVAQKKAAEFTKLMADKKAAGVDISSDAETVNAYNNLTMFLEQGKAEKTEFTNDVLAQKTKPNEFAWDNKYNAYATGDIPDDAEFYTATKALKNIVNYEPEAKDLALSVAKDVTGKDGRVISVYDPVYTKQRAEEWINSAFDPNAPNPKAAKFMKERAEEFSNSVESKVGTPEEKALKLNNYLVDETFKYFQSFQPTSDVEKQQNVTNVNVNTGAQPVSGKAVGTGPKEFELGFQTKSTGPKKGKISSIDGTVFEGADLQVLIPSNAIDVSTGAKLSGNLGTQKVIGGEMQIINVFKKGTKAKDGSDLSGTPIPDEYLNMHLKNGVVEPKLMFFGQIKGDDNVPSTNFFAPAETMIKNYDVLTASGKIGKQEIKEQYDRLENIVNQKRTEYQASSPKATTPQQGGQTKKIKAGDVVGGYRFKGGDTKDSKNWEKI